MTTVIETGGQMIIREANELVMARYRLTTIAQRLLLLLFSKIKREDEKFCRYELSLEQIYEILNLKKERIEVRRERLKRTLDILLKNILTIIGGRGDGDLLKMTAWIESPTIEWDKGLVSLRLAEHLKEYLLGQENDFTAYPYEEAIQFRSGYGFRLYKMCRNFHARAHFNTGIENGHYVHRETFSLEHFRKIVGVSPARHARIYNFREKVLEAARREVHEKTPYRFEYRLIRTGRPYTHVEFCFQGESVVCGDKDSKALSWETPLLKKELLELGVPEKTIGELKELGASAAFVKKTFAEYSIEQIEEAVRVAKEEDDENGLRHADGFLKKALKNGWRSKGTRKLDRKKKLAKAREAEETEEKRLAELAKKEEEKYAASGNKEKFKYVLKNLSGFRESYDALDSEDRDALKEYAYDVFESFSSYESTYKYLKRELREYE